MHCIICELIKRFSLYYILSFVNIYTNISLRNFKISWGNLRACELFVTFFSGFRRLSTTMHPTWVLSGRRSSRHSQMWLNWAVRSPHALGRSRTVLRIESMFPTNSFLCSFDVFWLKWGDVDVIWDKNQLRVADEITVDEQMVNLLDGSFLSCAKTECSCLLSSRDQYLWRACRRGFYASFLYLWLCFFVFCLV